MDEVIRFILDDGTTVAIESQRRDGSSQVGLRSGQQVAGKTLREAMAPVTAAATQVMDGFRGLAQRPQEVEITFGVKLDCTIGGVIASANADAHLDVTLRWRGPTVADRDGPQQNLVDPAAGSAEGATSSQ
jgi:hypothetical protein